MTYHPSDGQPALVKEQTSGVEYARRFGPAAIVLIAAVLFVLQNTEEVPFNFLWFEFTWPLWIILVAAMVAGAVIFWGAAARRRRRRRRNAD